MSSGSPTGTGKVVLKRKKSSLSEIKITVLGDREVGKSALVVRFLTKRFIMEYEHGTDNRYRHEVLIDNEPVIFDILDISSPTSFSVANFDFSHFQSDLLLLVYSITDRASFSYIRALLRHIAQEKSSTHSSHHLIPLVAIVGNKNDLIHLRQVSSEEGEILSTEYSELATSFFGEVSAAEQLLQSLFTDLHKLVKRHKAQQKTSLLDRVIGFKGTSNGSS